MKVYVIVTNTLVFYMLKYSINQSLRTLRLSKLKIKEAKDEVKIKYGAFWCWFEPASHVELPLSKYL